MKEVSVVIPTIKEEIVTLESLPDDVELHIERQGTLNEARNRGVLNSEADTIAVLDDDIRFTEETFWEIVERAEDRVVGIDDWNYGLFAGRVMIFPKQIWEDVGGFDEILRSHMGDTDFAIRVEKEGYDIEIIPREIFEHEEHERSIETWDHIWRGLYLGVKHPKWAPRLLKGMVDGT